VLHVILYRLSQNLQQIRRRNTNTSASVTCAQFDSKQTTKPFIKIQDNETSITDKNVRNNLTDGNTHTVVQTHKMKAGARDSLYIKGSKSVRFFPSFLHGSKGTLVTAHAIKAHRRRRGIAPLILNLGTR
jgi:hypothetical protein